MADHPLRPATDRRLGEPLPHQLANRPRADPGAACALCLQADGLPQGHQVLAAVSRCYPCPRGTLPTCYSPVRHSPQPPSEEIGRFSYDSHSLSTPPAFVLSQDQTLRGKIHSELGPWPRAGENLRRLGRCPLAGTLFSCQGSLPLRQPSIIPTSAAAVKRIFRPALLAILPSDAHYPRWL